MSLSARNARTALSALFVLFLGFAGVRFLPDYLNVSTAQEKRATQLKKTLEWRAARGKRTRKTRTAPAIATARPEALADQLALTNPLEKLIAESIEAGARPPEVERYDKPREAAEYFFLKRLPDDAEQLPLERYVEAQSQMGEMEQFSTATNQYAVSRNALRKSAEQPGLGSWTYLGPGNIGGRTRAIVINPQNPDVMYAGGVSGGVWKTTNGGQSWSPISDLIANIAIGSLALDPTDPNTIYAGTGEGFLLGLFGTGRAGTGTSSFIRGLGIYKSTDAGANWTRLPGTDNENFYALHDLVVSSKNRQRVYAATETGVWRSLDAGMTWSRILTVPSNVQGGALDLALRTDEDADVLLAACGTTVQARVYRTADASVETPTFSVVLEDTGMGRTVLAIAPSNQNTMYAVSGAFSGSFADSLHAVFRSTDGGQTWTPRVRNTSSNKMNRSILSSAVFATLTDCKYGTSDSLFGQALYDLSAAVDPTDPDRLWAGGIEWFRSDDGGANWGIAGFGYTPEGPFQVHPDQHAIAFHPNFNGTTNQTVYIGNDGGIFRSDNARAQVGTGNLGACYVSNNKVSWVSLNNGLGITQFYHGSVSPDGKLYFGGTQDNGTVGGTDADGPNRWREMLGGDGAYTAIDYYNPSTLYVSSQAGNVYKSDDGGKTFSFAKFGYGQGNFIDPYVMDPSDPGRIYIGVTALFRSPNGMTNWQQITPTLTTSPITSFAIAPTDSNLGLVGARDGIIIRTNRLLSLNTTAALGTPTEIAVRPRSGAVSWLAFDPTDKNIAYATYATFNSASATGHVFRTTNGGTSWTNIDGSGSGALPDVPTHCLVVDPSNNARLYVGTDVGVFVSTNGGASWAIENTGFANVITEYLEAKVINGETWLYAFTHGRGAWKVLANRSGCSYSVTPTTRNFGRDGGDVVVNITAAPASGCAWRAESNVPWIELAPNAQGTGNGTVALKVLANTTLSERAGTVNVAGRSFTILQEAQPDLAGPTLALAGTAPATTDQAVINLAGTVTDNVRVLGVNWLTDQGQSGAATLATSGTQWAVANLPLLSGRNTIYFTASDAAGNVSAPLIVTINATANSILATVAGTGTFGFNGDNLPAIASNISNPSGTMFFDGGGNFYFADFNLHRIRKVSPDGLMTTVAGSGVSGNTGDGGRATDARLALPRGALADANGNIYVLDAGNNRIRRVEASTGIISAFAGTGLAGSGGDGGPAVNANLNFGGLGAIALDKAGDLLIADSSNNRIRKVTISTGVITTIAGTGTAGFGGDGGAANLAQIRGPQSIVVDKDGNVFFADSSNFRVRKIAANDNVITTVAGNGVSGIAGDGGPATSATIGSVFGIAIDSNGNLYLSDAGNNRIRRVSTDGAINLIAGGGATGLSPDGSPALGARFSLARHLGVDAQNTLYIAEANNFRIRKLVNGVANDTTPPTVAFTQPATGASFTSTTPTIAMRGTATDNGSIASVRWSNDRGGSGAAVFGSGEWSVPVVGLANGVNNLAVTAWDVAGNTATARLAVAYAAPQVLLTIAGTSTASDSRDGIPAVTANLSPNVTGMALAPNGNVLIADSTNRRIRGISTAGMIQAFAGTGSLGSSGDGGPAANATMNLPRGMIFDAAGNLYFSDANAMRVRRVATNGTITTVAGKPTSGGDFSGDGGLATEAGFNGPGQIALDGQGNLYISDVNNFRVRKVNASDGKVNTIAGTGLLEYNGEDLLGTQANLYAPAGLAADAAGNLYIAEAGGQRIRKFNASDGKISTIAGTGVAGYNGDGIQAKTAQLNLGTISYLSLDPAGDLVIADSGNNRIRKITLSTGVITTIAGTGSSGFIGDGGSPLAANLTQPSHALVDAAGNLYIADRGNFRIRRTFASSAIKTVANVSAASYALPAELASEMVVAVFGVDLANSTASASTLPLPTSLSGTSLRIRDSFGVERLAPLFFVSPGQINYLVPSGTALGFATVTIVNARGEQYLESLNVVNVAPGLFAANANGQGPAAAVILRVKANGAQTYEDVVRFDAMTGRYAALPIDLGPEGDQVFLILFGTGFRNRSAVSAVTATVRGANAEVLYAGPQGGLGLDQANIRLSRSLIGAGDVEVKLSADGRASNSVRITIQ